MSNASRNATFPKSINFLTGIMKISEVFYSPDEETLNDEVWFNKMFFKVTVPILFGSIALVGAVGNLFVIAVILWKRQMQTHLNLLLMSLAVTDLLFVALCVPFVAYHYAADTWTLGEGVCKVWYYVFYVTVYVTVYTLVAVSVLRYLFVVYSTVTSSPTTGRYVLLLIAVLWILPVLSNIPIIYNYEIKVMAVPGSARYQYCAVTDENVGKNVEVTFFVFTYLLPLALVGLFYLLLLLHLKRTRQTSTLQSSSRKTTAKASTASDRRLAHVSRILVTVVVVMAICWLPLHVHLLMAYLGQTPKTRGYFIYQVLAHCLAYSNSCMNPIIYSFVSKDFRKSFKDIFICCMRKSNGSRCSKTECIDIDEIKR